jgi:hypothetical protein
MKKTYLLGLLGAFIVSCSSDDSGDNNNNNNPSGSFIPTELGNYWVYDVQSTTLSGRDSLYVAGDTVINNNDYKKLKTKEPVAYGFFSNALNNNGIRHSNGKAYLSGTAGLSISEQLPFNLDVSDFIVFDENASENQQLSLVEGTMNQEIEGYTVALNYKLTSKAKAPISNFTSGDEQYSNVKPVEITLNLGIDITVTVPGIPFPVTFSLMTPQNVAVSTQYYAQGIGAVKSVTDISYTLTELPNIELPIPSSGSEHQEEILVDYSVE